MIKLFIFLYFLFNPTDVTQTFEGSIEMVKKSFYETSYYTYFVKGDKIRIEEFNKNKKLVNVLLVDIPSKKVMALNPERKIFKYVRKMPYVKADKDKYEIIKTDYRKTINGYVCYQWRVKNKALNTEISYWVLESNLNFWYDLLKILDKTDNNSSFFLQIPGNHDVIPLLAVERTLVRDEKARTSVVEIESKELNKELFEIPKDYKLVYK